MFSWSHLGTVKVVMCPCEPSFTVSTSSTHDVSLVTRAPALTTRLSRSGTTATTIGG